MMESLWDEVLRRVWRGVRKTFGLAASADLAVLAGMLKAAAQMAESKVGYPISVILSFPTLPALRQEDVASAIEYAGLRTPTCCGKQLHELVAAYAGYEMSLSENKPELGNRGKKTHELPRRHLVLVEYTEVAILLYCAVLEKESNTPDVARGIRTSFELGSSNGASTEEVHDFVLEYLRDVSSSNTRWGFPEKISIMMTGSLESVGHAGIRQTIVGAVEAFGSRANVLYSDPGYVAARGAAEMAWRVTPQMESTEV
jgi:hypothetical protein